MQIVNEQTNIYLALPVLNEFENLPSLIECLRNQDTTDFELVVCVNQFEEWWNLPEKQAQCLNNQESILFLKNVSGLKIRVIDKSSKA